MELVFSVKGWGYRKCTVLIFIILLMINISHFSRYVSKGVTIKTATGQKFLFFLPNYSSFIVGKQPLFDCSISLLVINKARPRKSACWIQIKIVKSSLALVHAAYRKNKPLSYPNNRKPTLPFWTATDLIVKLNCVDPSYSFTASKNNNCKPKGSFMC